MRYFVVIIAVKNSIAVYVGYFILSLYCYPGYTPIHVEVDGQAFIRRDHSPETSII